MNYKSIELNSEQQAMLAGELGVARQMGMRLLLDMAAAAGAMELLPVESVHLSGVSPLTGGLGLRQFLAKLADDAEARVVVSTTLNSAGCDEAQFDAMRIVAPNFLEHNHEIVSLYTRLGVEPLKSCIPYEWDGVVTDGTAAWAESNAICFGNSYCGLFTNRESGLSALACALTGYTPKYGLLLEEARRPNLLVEVTAVLDDPTDFSILGDWIGTQRQSEWKMPLGMIPLFKGLPSDLNHEQKKALTSAAANYGCPLLYIDGQTPCPEPDFQGELLFQQEDLVGRYAELAPETAVSLIVIGCPQASVGELRAVAKLLQGKKVTADPVAPGDAPPIWVFTSEANRAIAEKIGIADIIRNSGALLLADTCPEVVPYDKSWVKYILTNSMKAEHYIKSGLNGISTSVMNLTDCIAIATGEKEIGDWGLGIRESGLEIEQPLTPHSSALRIPHSTFRIPHFSSNGHGLPSQSDFTVVGEAFVTDAPITLLGYVNRETGVIEEPGHPADGESMAGKIAIFPKGSGSTVAPYVLLELFYRGKAPLAIANTVIDQQCAPACSLENIPYAYGFDKDIIANIQHGDMVELRRVGTAVTLRALS